MSMGNEYAKVLETLYHKSLILENVGDFHPVLGFWYFDAMAHLDYSLSILAYNAESPRNLMSREYLKHRVDRAADAQLSQFPAFLVWLEEHYTQDFEKFPLFIQKVYSSTDPASYRSFRIIFDPDSKQPIPAEHFQIMVQEMFERSYLATVYNGSTVADRYAEFIGIHGAV